MKIYQVIFICMLLFGTGQSQKVTAQTNVNEVSVSKDSVVQSSHQPDSLYYSGIVKDGLFYDSIFVYVSKNGYSYGSISNNYSRIMSTYNNPGNDTYSIIDFTNDTVRSIEVHNTNYSYKFEFKENKFILMVNNKKYNLSKESDLVKLKMKFESERSGVVMSDLNIMEEMSYQIDFYFDNTIYFSIMSSQFNKYISVKILHEFGNNKETGLVTNVYFDELRMREITNWLYIRNDLVLDNDKGERRIENNSELNSALRATSSYGTSYFDGFILIPYGNWVSHLENLKRFGINWMIFPLN